MGRIVYSTDQGKLCPDCTNSITACNCAQQKKNLIIGDGVVRIKLETKGRKGKGVTIISGLAVNENDLKKLTKELKKRCGTGGAVKTGDIEIQGDQRGVIKTFLENKGYTAKLAGG